MAIDGNNHQIDMESANAILTIALKEYEYEADRARTLDTRSGTFLSISIATFALIANIFKLPHSISSILSIIFEISYFCLLLFLGISAFLFSSTLMTRKYTRYKLDDINKYSTMQQPCEILIPIIISTLTRLVDENTKVNNDKAIKYNHGIRFMLISVVFIILVIILKGG